VVITNNYGSTTSLVVTLTVQTVELTDGLQLFLPVEGNANDASGNGRHGIVSGATLTSNRFDQADSAYAFSGGSYITVTNLDPDDYAEGFSFGGWVRPVSGGGYVAYWDYDAGWGSTFIALAAPGTLTLRLGSGNPATSYGIGGLNLTIGQWHHLVATHDADWNRFYVNGVKVFEATSLPLQGNIATVLVGPSYIGDMDEFVVFGRGLSSNEVFSLYIDGLSIGGEAPGITTEPQSLAVNSGAVANFSVTATGVEPLMYQWRKGGMPISDSGYISGAETADVSFAYVQLGDAGDYDVVITNN
jgi:hypothetical protein